VKQTMHSTFLMFLFACLLPLTGSCQTQVVKHTSASLLYDETVEQALAVRYELDQIRVKNGLANTRSGFRLDPKVTTRSANPDDFVNTNYDRGHLAPFESFRGNEIGAMESFYMSNISPQLQRFNRGFWSKLESMLYAQLDAHPNMIIFCGPIFIKNGPAVSVNGVTIPDMFYKVAFDRDTNQPILCIVVPHDEYVQDPALYITSLAYCETLTHLNFEALEKTLKLK
jgi:endonuclease G, mitochondrial